MSLLELGVVLAGVILVLVAFLIKRGLFWAIPMAYHGVAFIEAVVNHWSAFTFVPIGGFAILSLIVFVTKMFRGDFI